MYFGEIIDKETYESIYFDLTSQIEQIPENHRKVQLTMNKVFFAEELELMRDRYKQNPPEMLLKGNVFDTEQDFIDLENADPLNVIYREEQTLIKKGNVFMGCIVQANENLYKWFPPLNYPADMIYSPDPILGTDISRLYAIAEKLYSYKDRPQDAPEELHELAEWITDEMTRFFNVPLPDSLTGGKEVYITTFQVMRKNLPGRKLQQNVLPILAAPGSCKSSAVLPIGFWSERFLSQFWKG